MQKLFLSFVLYFIVSGLAFAASVPDVGVTECDRLASVEFDDERVAAPVVKETMKVNEALKACKQALEKYPDHPRLMYLMGIVFAMKDNADSFIWFKKASEKNYVAAWVLLGKLYVSGKYVSKNIEKAQHLFLKAAKKGNTEAEFSLGVLLFFLPDADEKSRNKGLFWMDKAASKKHLGANLTLSIIYADDKFIPHDFEKVLVYTQPLIEKKFPWQMYLAGEILVSALPGPAQKEKQEKGIALLEEAYSLGIKLAAAQLAIEYLSPNTLGIDEEKARHWFCKAEQYTHKIYENQLKKKLICH